MGEYWVTRVELEILSDESIGHLSLRELQVQGDSRDLDIVAKGFKEHKLTAEAMAIALEERNLEAGFLLDEEDMECLYGWTPPTTDEIEAAQDGLITVERELRERE